MRGGGGGEKISGVQVGYITRSQITENFKCMTRIGEMGEEVLGATPLEAKALILITENLICRNVILSNALVIKRPVSYE